MSRPLPRKIFLLRHARSELNAAGRTSGQLDTPLTEEGHDMARRVVRLLAGEAISAVYSSPLVRCMETARPIAEHHGLPIQTRGALRELHLGVLQGRPRDVRDPEAARIYAAWRADPVHIQVPGAETWQELEARVLPCLAALLEQSPDGIPLVVGHRHTHQVIAGALLHWRRPACLDAYLKTKYLYEIVPGAHPDVHSIRLAGEKLGRRTPGLMQK